jgi:hypothetical protein
VRRPDLDPLPHREPLAVEGAEGLLGHAEGEGGAAAAVAVDLEDLGEGDLDRLVGGDAEEGRIGGPHADHGVRDPDPAGGLPGRVIGRHEAARAAGGGRGGEKAAAAGKTEEIGVGMVVVHGAGSCVFRVFSR